jgi:hypothetical protein
MATKAELNKLKSFSITIMLIFILVMPVVLSEISINTYSTDISFNAYVPSEVSVCSCGTNSGNILIKNTGVYPARFGITSDNDELFNVPLVEFSIKAGKEISVPYTVNTDCDFSDEEVTLLIKNSFNIEKEFVVDVKGLSCQNLAAELMYDKQSIKPCEAVSFTLFVENIDDFTETYYYDFGKYQKYLSYDYGSVTLPPHELGQFNMSLTIPCQFYGNYSIPVDVYSAGTKQHVTFEADLFVEQDYPFSYDLSPDLFTCAEDDTILRFNLRNNAEFENTFYFKSLYPDFVRLKTNKVLIPGGESAEIEFEVFGSMKELGWHEIAFELTTDLGDITETINSGVHIGKCYDLGIYPEPGYNKFYGRELEDLSFIVKNNGDIKQDIFLDLADWNELFLLKETNITLESGQEKRVYIDVSNVPDTDEIYKLPIFAYLPSKDLGFTKDMIVDVTSSFVSHRAIIDPSIIKINYDDTEASFNIRNIGSEDLWYNITINPYLPNESTWIHMKKNIIIHLESMQEETINIEFDSGDYTVAEGNYLFNVVIDPMYSYEDLLYAYDLNIKLRDKSFFYYTGLWMYGNPLLVILALIIIFLIWLLFYLLFSKRPKNLKEKKKRKKKARNILFGFIAFLLLLLLLLLIFFPLKALHPAVDNNPDDLNITFYSDEEFVVELGKYFIDPDGDILDYYVKVISFGNKTLEGLDITLEGSTATIKSIDDNVTGIIPLWFYATDSKFYTKSDVFLVNVVKKQDYSFMEIIDYYIYYVIWLALIILISIYMTALFVWASKRTKRQHDTDKKD